MRWQRYWLPACCDIIKPVGPHLPGPSSLKQFLENARRRELMRLAADKGALAIAVVMGGAAVLLLLGTQILDWYWLALLGMASLGTGVYQLRKHIPSLYSLAQRIDHRLRLADALSTAQYFSENPSPGREAICEMQRKNAEEAARAVDLKAAVPFERSRFALPAAALAVAAMGLFGVRYLVTGSLDLQPSLLKIAYDSFFGIKPYEGNNQLPPRAKLDPKTGAENPPNNPLADADVPPPQDLNSPQDPNGQSGDNSKEAAQNPADTNDSDPNQNNKQEGAQPGEQSGQGKNSQDQSPNSNPTNSDKNGNPDSKNGSNEQGLMDKLRDALANMMNKMKSSEQGQQKQAQNSRGQQGDKSDGQKGGQSKDKQQSQADMNGDTQSQEGEQKDSADSQSSEKAGQKNAQQDAKNGIGSQDGEKALREAQQLQTMGKITELLGKRAQNVSGEVMVEVGSSKQTLKTEWAQHRANHAEAGGEIHRDEVPLMYQQFVQQYFEEIRKGEPSSAKASKSTP